MPYEIIEHDNEYCVQKVGTDELEGCHPTMEDAEAQLTALRINVEGEEMEPEAATKSVDLTGLTYIIKAVVDGDEWALDVLGAPYGGPNRGKDRHGEFFSPRTNFYEDKNPPLPLVTYYHGYTPEGKPQGAPEIIGKTTKRWRDDKGLWFRVVLDKASALAQRVWEAAKLGTARASSGVAGMMGRTRATGEITDWLIGELAVWDADGIKKPANDFAIVNPAVKALFEEFLTDPQTDPVGGETHGQAVEELELLTDLNDLHSAQEIPIMADETTVVTPPEPVDITAVVNNAVKAALDADRAARLAEEAAAQAEQERIDAAVEAARVKWEADHASERRLYTGDNAPNVAQFGELWKYDNLDPGDRAFLAGVLQGAGRKPSDNLLKAMAIGLVEDTQPHFNRTRSIMQGSGMPVKANELNQSTLASYGDAWALDAVDMSLWERVWSNAGIINNLPTVEVPQGVESITIPLQGTPPTFYKVAQASAQDTNTLGKVTYTVTSSKMGATTQSLTVGKLGARDIFTGELEEDSMIPWVTELRNNLSMEAVEILESLVVDGDTATGATTNINDIAGTPAGTEYFLVLDGFRKLALVTNTENSRSAGALTAEDFLETLKLMGIAGKNAFNVPVAFILDPWTHWKSLELPEVKTRDVFANPTLENGKLVNIYGYDVIPTYNMHRPGNVNTGYELKANTSGKIDVDTVGNNTTGSILAVRWDQWRFGWKRRIKFETYRVPQADATEIICTMRCGLVYRDTEASAISYGVTV